MVNREPGPRRIVLWAAATLAALILLFSYRTSFGGVPPTAAATQAGPQAPGVVPAPTTTASGRPGGAPGGSVVVNGSVARTRWGPVQVQVTISGTRIAEVIVLQQPSGNGRDREINSFALPRLRQETLQSQSARIDAVSGATVTSGGYVESLQAALDAAHFGQ